MLQSYVNFWFVLSIRYDNLFIFLSIRWGIIFSTWLVINRLFQALMANFIRYMNQNGIQDICSLLAIKNIGFLFSICHTVCKPNTQGAMRPLYCEYLHNDDIIGLGSSQLKRPYWVYYLMFAVRSKFTASGLKKVNYQTYL